MSKEKYHFCTLYNKYIDYSPTDREQIDCCDECENCAYNKIEWVEE